RPGVCAADVAEERRHRSVSSERRTVDLDLLPADLSPRLLELVNAPRELRFARAGRSAQQDRIARCDGHPLDAFDEPVVGGVLRVDAGLQQREALRALLLEAPCDAVVA